jgi:aminoglycoside phosphotransferase (APT) family kinase protein
LFLSQLKGIVPVPEVVHVLLEPDLFGVPALLTPASGQPLDHELQRLSDASIKAIMVEIAEAIAALHNVNSSNLPVDSVYDPQLLLDQWQEDSEWYITNADGAGKAAGLVRKGCISAGKHIWGA